MIQTININTNNIFNIENFISKLDVDLIIEMEGYDDNYDYFYLSRPGYSTSMFFLSYNRRDKLTITIDMLASYDDYRFFPYLADCINIFLNGNSLKIDGKRIYDVYNEDWIAECIGEEIALLKSTLTVFHKYYQELPLKSGTYFSTKQLNKFGVNLYSSTPRIYGYIQYIIKNNMSLSSTEEEILSEQEDFSNLCEIMVDVPQHESIGKVKSWQIDGSETYESYSREDVDMLISLADKHLQSPMESQLCGVVMNDIGTIYQEGIGVNIDGEKAIYWFSQAIAHGDRLYAASNLGDLYRKGCGVIKPSLAMALDAYLQSDDYYAMYRIGQAYEEGWVEEPDLQKAMIWYKKAAHHGHHLAIKRLRKDNLSV